MSGQRGSLPRARRSLGQNFLINPGVRDKIIDALEPSPTGWVVEIGPGPGALTGPLTARCGHVVAVEMDRALAEALPGTVARSEVLEVQVGDGAEVDYASLAGRAGQPLRVVGNLPFNAANAILRHALDQARHLDRLVLMFQREVALRLCAGPGNRDYGLLTVVTQQRARVTRLFDVSPGSFRPTPKVAATVLRLDPLPHPPGACCLAVHDALLRAAFAQRRKTIKNSMRSAAPWPWESLQPALEEVGISPEQRAETVGVGQWLELARLVCPMVGSCDG